MLLLYPCLALTFTTLAINPLCEVLRGAVDRQGRGHAPNLRAIHGVVPGLVASADPALVLAVGDDG